MGEARDLSAGRRPAVLLDIDGVLQIAYERQVPPGLQAKDKPHHWLAYNPAHGPWLRSLERKADIYYISDWQHLAHQQIGVPLGVPAYEYIDCGPRMPGVPAGAVRALAITAMLGKRPVVWIDDEITQNEHAWAARRNAEDSPTLLVPTNDSIGLQAPQMERVTHWLRLVTPDDKFLC